MDKLLVQIYIVQSDLTNLTSHLPNVERRSGHYSLQRKYNNSGLQAKENSPFHLDSTVIGLDQTFHCKV